jgi:hypothetical protein
MLHLGGKKGGAVSGDGGPFLWTQMRGPNQSVEVLRGRWRLEQQFWQMGYWRPWAGCG